MAPFSFKVGVEVLLDTLQIFVILPFAVLDTTIIQCYFYGRLLTRSLSQSFPKAYALDR